MQTYNVTALNTGTLRVQKAAMTYGSGFGEQINIPVWSAAVEGGGQRILVDTGVRDHDKWNQKIHPVWRDEDEELERALAEIGWRPSDVDIVINTHLHYDHAENNLLFPNAQFIVSRTEWEYAQHPIPSQVVLYDFSWTDEVVQKLNYSLVAVDDHDVLPGLRLIQTPGHTPGHQSVVINTTEGTVCVAGDAACLYECFRGPVAPAGATSIEQAFDSLERIRLSADRVLMAHDPNIHKYQNDSFPLMPQVGDEPLPGELITLPDRIGPVVKEEER
jgi:glyoxylase-like metal-dependent hydrolase (beta-lactamase superfamily II)